MQDLAPGDRPALRCQLGHAGGHFVQDDLPISGFAPAGYRAAEPWGWLALGHLAEIKFMLSPARAGSANNIKAQTNWLRIGAERGRKNGGRQAIVNWG